MNEPENFLTRWSRRKLEPADEHVPADEPDAAGKPAAKADEAKNPVAAGAPATQSPPVPEFDLSSLPPIESIAADTDISAFLKPGVPSALRHAALRRAWSTDPAIRDFIGPSEYAWDFTAPDSMPGFGELGPDVDVKKLVAEIFRGIGPETEPPTDKPAPPSAQSARPPDKSDIIADVPAANEPATAPPQQLARSDSDNLLQRDENIATQHVDSEKQPAAIKSRRHGSATPQ